MGPHHTILVDTWEGVNEACNRIREHSIIAFDMEGVKLGRDGLVTLLQIAINKRTVFCFDVLVLGGQLFAYAHLGSILSSCNIIKLCFDCRVDGDVLRYQFGVVMNMLYDIQVLYTLLFQSHEDPRLKGLPHVIQKRGVIEKKETLAKVLQCKRQVKESLFHQSKHDAEHVFLTRPIKPEILDYCSSDVVYLLRMHSLWGHLCNLHLVLHITKGRLDRFCNRVYAIPPSEMSLVDFETKHQRLPST